MLKIHTGQIFSKTGIRSCHKNKPIKSTYYNVGAFLMVKRSEKMDKLKIEYVPIDSIKPYENNAK